MQGMQIKVLDVIECLLIEWLIDCDGVRLCLRTAATNRPIFHPLGYMWT
jgi:hypothetical protein